MIAGYPLWIHALTLAGMTLAAWCFLSNQETDDNE